MIERSDAEARAQEWLDAWNAHDVDGVVSHFADDVVVHSPLAARLRPGSDGVLRGREAVRAYYRDGLAAGPDLRFELVEVCTGVDELAIVYRNQRGVLVVETLVIGPDGLASEVHVSYGA